MGGPTELAEALAAGRAAWEGVDLAEDAFANAVARHCPASEPLDGIRSTDLYLATACAAGDAAALKHLDDRILCQIGATIRRIDSSPAFIDEVRQELRVHLLLPRGDKPPRISEYSGRGALGGWVHVAAARLALTMKRAGGARSDVPSTRADPGTMDAETLYLRERYRDDLQTAFEETIRELTTRQRNILRMHFIDGIPLDRLATIYGMHRTTLGRWVTSTCDEIMATARRRLGARVQLPAGAMDSIVAILRSEIDFTASLLLSDASLHPGEDHG
jgi:RNA polymerase sigma-70 factor (ECF subfamily)